jgi:hypothetical protein
MAHHPPGESVDIVGLEQGNRGRSCEEHDVCGSIVKLDTVIRLRTVQVDIDGREETAIAAVWVTDGVDRCRVGFLPRHCVRHAARYNGKLAQVVDMYKDSDSPTKKRHNRGNCGSCRAILIDAVMGTTEPPTKRQRRSRIQLTDNPHDYLSEGTEEDSS